MSSEESPHRTTYTQASLLCDQKQGREATSPHSQAAEEHISALDPEDKDSLDSFAKQAKAGHGLGEDSKAKSSLLRAQAVEEHRKMVDQSEEETLKRIHNDAATLHNRGEYREAEKLFRMIVESREASKAKDSRDKYNSIHGLADTLFAQGRFKEAEPFFRQAAKGYTGKEDIRDTMYWLANTLYELGNYSEAEKTFKEAEQRRNPGRGERLTSILGRAWSLYYQEKYAEAEDIFRKIEQRPHARLGEKLKGTSGLVAVLHSRGKNIEAEQKCNEALQAVEARKKNLGNNTEDISGIRQIQEKVGVVIARTKNRLDSLFSPDYANPLSYNASNISDIADLLSQLDPRWSRAPRIYIVLRKISCSHLMNEFANRGISDYLLPFDAASPLSWLSHEERKAFLDGQVSVLEEKTDLEKGGHHYFDKFPLEKKAHLGEGGFGIVSKVFSQVSLKEYAQKQVSRSKDDVAIKKIVSEIEILEKVRHRHIVELIGSYSTVEELGFIMTPVAETDLETYLKNARAEQFAEIRTFFGCLATALEYLHSEKVRHKDITSANILFHQGKILFTDFGLSRDFTDASSSTTMGTVFLTVKYCAPEVMDKFPRNTSSDIWSLGVVFLDMIVILKGKSIEWVENYLHKHGERLPHAWANKTGLQELGEELKKLKPAADNVAVEWIQQMLSRDKEGRLTAHELVIKQRSNRSGKRFCGKCCLPLNV